MKTYSETMKSVLEKAAVITEEKQEKAQKTRSRLKTVLGAALAFALIIGAVLVIKPFGERGDGGQLGYGADSEKSTPAVEETPSCGGDPDFTSETAEPIFITEKTEVIWNDDTYALNIDRFLTMLEADGYINAADGVKHKEYDIENSDFCNLTPEYFRENFPEIEVFCDQEHRGRAYFLRFGDKLYCYEGITINNMCLWDYDGSGVDDLALRLYKYDEGIAYQWIECMDAVTGELKPIFARRADFTSSRFVFDYDGKSIYVDKLLLEYRDGQAYIGSRLASDHAPSFDWAEHDIISSEHINVKEYANGSSDNVELAYSILRSSGFIFEDGRRYTELDISDLSLRNCTSDYVIKKTDDIELFYNDPDEWSAYFIRVGNELYRHDAFGGHHIYMLLWDYDKNGVEDVVMVSEAGSGTTSQEAVVFDVSTKEFKDIIHRNVYTDINFTFHFDGENIYIYLKKVEYKGGEFLIDGIIVRDYNPVPPTKEPEITPEPKPSDHPSYAYPSFLCIAPDDFSFTIQWGVGAYSSYDSRTGRLVKTTDTTHPEDYVTHWSLSKYQINCFYTCLTWHMDIFGMPDEYDPINDPASESKIQSEPYETIILTVRADGREKTVTCPEIPLGDHYGYCHHAYTFYNMGVRYITDLLMSSPAWQALPEYEFFYE